MRGNADDPGTSLTFYDYADQYAGLSNQRPTLYNDPLADRNYKSIELAVSRRLANNWQFRASYSATQDRRTVPDRRTRRRSWIRTPRSTRAITPGNGARARRAPISSGGASRCRATSSTAAAIRWHARSRSRTVPSRIRRCDVEPLGSSRLPNINLLDVRVPEEPEIGRLSAPRTARQRVQSAQHASADDDHDALRTELRPGQRQGAPGS